MTNGDYYMAFACFQNEKRDERGHEDGAASVDNDESEAEKQPRSGLCAINSLSLLNLTNTTFFEMYLQVGKLGVRTKRRKSAVVTLQQR